MKNGIIRKVMALALTVTMVCSNLVVAKADNSSEVQYPVTYSSGVTVTGSGSDYSNLSNFYDGGGTFTVKEDGSVTLKYNLARVSTGIFTKTYYDSNVYYYKVNESDEYQRAEETWGSERATEVEFDVDSTDVRTIYIKADVYVRGESNVTATIEGTATFDVTQAKAPVFNTVNQKFTDTEDVVITSSELGSTIYYTIDGDTKQYTGPVEIDKSTTISAYSVVDSYIVSETIETTYEKVEQGNLKSVSVKARNAGDYSKDSSYDALVSEEAFIKTLDNGETELILTLLNDTMMDMDCYLEDITYYTASGSQNSVEILQYFDASSYINSGLHPALVIAVPIIDSSSNYVEMRAQAGTNSWYVNYHDFTMEIIVEEPEVEEPEVEEPEVEDEEDQPFVFGKSKTKLSEGTYSVPAKIMQAYKQTELSMADGALDGDVILHVNADGSGYLHVGFQPMDYYTLVGTVTFARYYQSLELDKSKLTDTTVLKSDENGNPTLVAMDVTHNSSDGIFVQFDVRDIGQDMDVHVDTDAYLVMDYASSVVYEAPEVEEPEVEEPEVEEPEVVLPADFITKNLKAVGVGASGVKLTWDAVDGAKGYLVYAQKNGKYAYAGMTTQGTTFTDKNAIHDDYNYYWVFPYMQDSTGKMYPGSCESYKYATTACAAVTYFRAGAVTGGVSLTWVGAEGAEGYLVYGRRAGGTYEYIGMTTQGTSYTDTKASKTDYNFYWVFAYHSDSNGKMVVGATPTYKYALAK